MLQLARALRFLVPSCLLLASASAQTLRVSVTDAADPVPGRTRVEVLDAARAPEAGPGHGSSVIGQMPGWPITVGGSGLFAPWRGLVFADLDLDGDQEVVMSSTDGRLYAWQHDGTPVAGFPVNLKHASQVYAQSAPTVADLDADGDLEIVQLTRGITSDGRFWILDHAGQALPGFPKSLAGHNIDAQPTAADLDDDGLLEILLQERDGTITHVRVFEVDGSEWGGNWPVDLDHVPTVTPAVADVDADGAPEIVLMSYTSIYALEADGTILPGWPQGIAGANFSYQSPALVDLDGDQDLEIVLGAHQAQAGVYVFHHDGAPYPGWPFLVGTWTYCPPTVVDLEGDGEYDVLAGRAGVTGGTSALFWAWDSSGAVRAGFPYSQAHGGGAEGPITTYDLDGDGVLETFTDHNIAENGQGFLFGVDAAGNDLPGFPLRPAGVTYLNGAMIGDVDGDGDTELGCVTWEGAVVHVNLYDLPESWRPAAAKWPTYHKAEWRGGRAARGRSLFLSGASALGGSVRLTLVGAPGNRGSLWLSTAQAHSATPWGWLHLQQPFRRTYASNKSIPPTGELSVTQVIPSVAGLVGTSLWFQGLERWPGGGEVTNLARVVILP